MTAAVPLGALIAAIFAGPIIDRFGRRRVLMFAAALFTAGALIAGAITAIWMLVAARLVLGVAIGMAAVGAPLYISETAPIKSRGAMVSTYQLGDNHRHPRLLSDRPGDHWQRHVAPHVRAWARCPDCCSWSASPSCRIAALADPEAAHADQARASLRRLRGERWDVDGELQEMVPQRQGGTGRGVGYRALFEPNIRPAVIVAVGLFFLQQLERHQCRDLLRPGDLQSCRLPSGETRILATVGIGTVNFATTVLAMFLIDRLGRRPLLVLGLPAPPRRC